MNETKKIKILFFTPFAGYTGSEVMLFTMLRNMDPEKFEVALFSMEKGEMLDTLPAGIPSYYFRNSLALFQRIKNKVLKIFTGKLSIERQVMDIHRKFQPDIWYLNTMLLLDIVEIAQKNRIKYAVHFHELQSQYKYITASGMQKLVDASFTVGCCECVCSNLKILDAKKIYKQYECFDSGFIKVDDGKKQSIRDRLKISENLKVITMSGQRTDRKGVDIFINVAKELQGKPYFFLWLGATQSLGDSLFFEKYTTHHKMTNVAFIHPSRKEYYNYLDLTDVFFLSSREDPFPLVMLEAAFLGKYIVSLNSGGVNEFLNKDVGYIINSWNLPDIAGELDQRIQMQAGNILNGKAKEQALRFDVSNQVKLFEDIFISEYIR